jgi:hypothetical protein
MKEFKVLWFGNNELFETLETVLTNYVNHGWEIVSITQSSENGIYVMVVFSRELK